MTTKMQYFTHENDAPRASHHELKRYEGETRGTEVIDLVLGKHSHIEFFLMNPKQDMKNYGEIFLKLGLSLLETKLVISNTGSTSDAVIYTLVVDGRIVARGYCDSTCDEGAGALYKLAVFLNLPIVRQQASRAFTIWTEPKRIPSEEDVIMDAFIRHEMEDLYREESNNR